MNTYQQIKLFEGEAYLIYSKELAERENSEVADEKVNYEEIVKICLIGCVSIFSRSRTADIYIPRLTKS
jgi:hypothetical protein